MSQPLSMGKPTGGAMDGATGWPTSPPTEEHRLEFTGTAGEFFRIWIVNLSLTVLTLGVYSAWAKVRTSRYFAAHTHLAGSSFEYLADPRAILKGRMIVFGALVVYSTASTALPLLQPVLGIALFLSLPWAVSRSLAFRAHNTAWRNIRFAFGGGFGDAFKAYAMMPVMGLITLGIGYPYAIFTQRRFMVDHAAFGTTRFRLGSMPADFYGMFFVIFIVGTASAILFGSLAAVGALVLGSTLASEGSETLASVFGFAIVLPAYFTMFAAYSAQVMNLTYDGAELGEHRITSRIPIFGLSWIYLTNAIAILASLGLLIPWSHVRLTRYRLGHMRFVAVGSLDEFAAAQGDDVSSLGGEYGEAFDFDFGL